MSHRLELRERIYRSFPEPLITLLLGTKGVGQPSAIVESVEGSTGIPLFGDDEFGLLLEDMSDMASNATKQLEALQARSAPTRSS